MLIFLAPFPGGAKLVECATDCFERRGLYQFRPLIAGQDSIGGPSIVRTTEAQYFDRGETRSPQPNASLDSPIARQLHAMCRYFCNLLSYLLRSTHSSGTRRKSLPIVRFGNAMRFGNIPPAGRR